MSNPTYKSVYSAGGISAWAPTDGNCDHLFVWQGAVPTAALPTLDDVLAKWNGATVSAGVTNRSIYFCQTFDLSNIAATLGTFFTTPSATEAWNSLAYWRERTFAGGPGILFPTGNATPISIGDAQLSITGPAPSGLDDFQITIDSVTTAQLLLTLKTTTPFQWSIYGADGTASSLILPLKSFEGYVAGALGLSMKISSGPDASHPIRKIGFLYQAAPTQMPVEGDGPAFCRFWTSALVDDVDDGTTCNILLDPRDTTNYYSWLGDLELNSRVEPLVGTLHTSLYSPTGDRFKLTSMPSATARLGVVQELMDAGGIVYPGQSLLFHPEGLFAIVKPATIALTLNLSSLDLLAGSATTEFFDLSAATHVHFDKRQPAFFMEDTNQLPIAPFLNGSKNGQVLTSHLSFFNATVPPDKTVPPDYHTQPDSAPLFENSGASPVPGHLGRRRKNFGTALITMPVFPFAGTASDPTTPLGGDLRRFDSTHLAAYRRTNSRPPIATPTSLIQPEALLPAATVATTLAITPQGLLAEVDDLHNYRKLYFGNADFGNASAQAATEDFSITLTDDGSGLYQQLQHALSSNQLFMVFRNPDPVSGPVIEASANLQTHGFSFSINGELFPSAVQPVPSTAVLLIKFFTGKSLADLVGMPSLWVCQPHLAPNGNGPDASGKAPIWSGLDTTTDPELQQLKGIWNDKTWQGVMALNFPITMPDLLEALRPGLSAPPGGAPVLRAQYVGINAVPVRQSDLPATPPPTPPPAPAKTPNRPASVFGLISYKYDSKSMAAPQGPDVNNDPGGASSTPPKYSFIVQLLDIAIWNSQISRFQADVELGFDHLLLDAGGSPDGTPLTLNGSYESRPQANGFSQDVFSLSSTNSFPFVFGANSYIKQVTISHAQLTVAPSEANSPLRAIISFDATLVMSDQITDDIPFPFFTVKTITLSSFGFGFTYQEHPDPTPPDFSFFFQAGSISADIDFTPPEGALASLLSALPVKLKGMQISLGSPMDLVTGMNFTQIHFPGASARTFQFGFLMEIDFGSLGQLAGSLSSLRLPLLLGWSQGKGGICFGIQFPTFSGGIDIGVQQFVRLQAKQAVLNHCTDQNGAVSAIAIQLVEARVVMFGKQWPDADVDIIFFIPVGSGRKVSWAFGVKSDPWYIGGGYRILIPGLDLDGATTKTVVTAFQNKLSGLKPSSGVIPSLDPCSILPSLLASTVENWSVIGSYTGEAAFNIGIAVADPSVYGVNLAISDFDLDLLYHRVNDQLGIFSIELALPLATRTMQFGAATVRLPVFRMEIHTDGGYLADFGFPWNNDYSRSAQVEVYIFLGSGGFYYGVTAASATTQLAFGGGYGFSSLSVTETAAIENKIRTVRVGYASRGGIGRSFTIGILNAEASLTLFGSLEGASAYQSETGTSLFNPLLYAISGTMGLMLDISASVDFGIIQASAHILAYAEFGIELRRVLAKDSSNEFVLLTLPIVVFTEVALSIGVDVSIHIGCVDVTIHLHFSATWRLQFTFGGLSQVPAPPSLLNGITLPALAAEAFMALTVPPPPPPPTWNPAWRLWVAAQPLNLQATVIPCMASAADLGSSGASYQTAVVGTQMLPVDGTPGGFSDLSQCLAGWVLLSGNPASYGATLISLGTVIALQNQIAPGPDPVTPNPAAPLPDQKTVWSGFPAALPQLLAGQFTPSIEPVPVNTSGANPTYAIIPPYPGSQFSFLVGSTATTLPPKTVQDTFFGIAGPADTIAFVEYCRHLLVQTILEIRQIVENKGLLYTNPLNPAPAMANDPNMAVSWSDIWNTYMSAVPPPGAGSAPSDPSSVQSPVQRMASDLARHLLHGARPTDATNHTTASAISTGQELAVAVPAGGGSLNFRFSIGTSTAPVKIANTDALYHDGFMNAVLGNSAYFALAPDLSIPTWVFHQRKYAWAKPAAADTLIVMLLGTTTKLVTVALPSAVVEEVDDDHGSVVTMCLSGSDTPLPSISWQPAIVIRFPLTLVAPTGSALSPSMQIFKVSGATQGDRYFLDQLGLLPPVDANAPKRIGIVLTLETKSVDGKTVTPSPISEWTIARTNLTDQARPNSEGLVPEDFVQPAYPYPYVAGPGAPDDVIRLLQMNSITNSGGYYLRATTNAATASTLVLTVILEGVPTATTGTDATQSALLPAAANAIAFQPDNTGQPTTTFPDSVRFEGLKHVQVAPATPPGSVLFGWTRNEPDPPTTDEDLFGYGTISLLAYSVSDATGAVIQPSDTAVAISASDSLNGDQFDRSDSSANPQHTGTSSAMRLRSGSPAASTSVAGQLVPRPYRGRYKLPDAATTPWKRLADPDQRQLTFAPMLRDVFGNPFASSQPAPFQRLLFYTDTLVSPSEWPGITFAVYPALVAGQPNLCLEMSYTFLAPNNDATSSFRDKTARLNQLTNIVIQLLGADGDVTVALNATPILKASVSLPVSTIIMQIQSWSDLESKNADPAAKPLLATPLYFPCDGAITDIAVMEPSPISRFLTRSFRSLEPSRATAHNPRICPRIKISAPSSWAR